MKYLSNHPYVEPESVEADRPMTVPEFQAAELIDEDDAVRQWLESQVDSED